MLHRKLYTFVLILALLLAQVGAVRHYVEHLSDVGESSHKQDAIEKHASLCEKCIQYDLLGQGLGSMPTKIFGNQLKYQDLSRTPLFLISRAAHLYAARAPPLLV